MYLFLILAALGAGICEAKIGHPWAGGLIGVALWALVMLVASCFVRNDGFARFRAALAILAAAGLAVLVFGVEFDFDPSNLGIQPFALTGNGAVNAGGGFSCTLYNASNVTISEATIDVQTYNSRNRNEHSDVRRFEIKLNLKPLQTESASVSTGLQTDYRKYRVSYGGDPDAATAWVIARFKMKASIYRWLSAPGGSLDLGAHVGPMPLMASVEGPPPAPVPVLAQAPALAIPQPAPPPPPPPPPPALSISEYTREVVSVGPARTTPGHFSVGSTKDEVLAVQGTPTKLGDREWQYGFSTIHFNARGQVIRWDIYRSSPLKVKMESSLH
jgi:hypothetical protein